MSKKYKKTSLKNVERERADKKQNISVVINTYNAERLLEQAIQSVNNAYEIVICDMYSTDRTIEIAQKYNCKICYHEKLPQPDPARNYAISQATGDWILILDADEIVSKDLWKELNDYANNPYKDYYCLNLHFKTYFLDGFLTHLEPEYHLRFFKNGCLKYEEGNIHVAPYPVNSQVLCLKEKGKDLNIYHYTNENFYAYLHKRNFYTNEELKKANWKKFNKRPKSIKIISYLLSAMIRFFTKGAYKDGFRGFVWSLYHGIYKIECYIKALEYSNNWQEKQTDNAISRL